MRQRRLLWLVGVMCLLAILRFLSPPLGGDSLPPVAQAIVRNISASPTAYATVRAPAAHAVRSPAIDAMEDPGNAFGVRPSPPSQDVSTIAAAMVKATPTAAKPAAADMSIEPSSPPMPYKVIGTWDDGNDPGVFLSSPTGTLLARRGAILQAEYKVVAITPQQVSLMYLPTKREMQLAVLRPANTKSSYP